MAVEIPAASDGIGAALGEHAPAAVVVDATVVVGATVVVVAVAGTVVVGTAVVDVGGGGVVGPMDVLEPALEQATDTTVIASAAMSNRGVFIGPSSLRPVGGWTGFPARLQEPPASRLSTMKRLLLFVALLVLVPALPAAATTPADTVAVLSEQGFYVDGGLFRDPNQLAEIIAGARQTGFRLMVVVLDEQASTDPVTFADSVLDSFQDGTVLVLTDDGLVGVASSEFSQAETERALDVADARGGNDVQYTRAFTDELIAIFEGGAATTSVTSTDSSTGSGGGGSGVGLIILLVIVGALIGLVFFAVRRQQKRTKERSEEDLATARAEIKAQLDACANDILDLADVVRVAGIDAAQTYYTQGSATYADAIEEFDKAETLSQFSQLAIKLDLATWELDAAENLVDGRPLPPKPTKRETSRCFFDPAHRGPFERADIQTNAGSKEVRVCRRDAELLRQGQSPEPRMVRVGGRSVPAASAPRSHGGGGFGALDMFSILVGGMAGGLPQRWGSGARSRPRLGRGRSASRSSRRSIPSPSTSRRSRSSRSTSPSRSRSRGSGKTRSRTGRRRRR